MQLVHKSKEDCSVLFRIPRVVYHFRKSCHWQQHQLVLSMSPMPLPCLRPHWRSRCQAPGHDIMASRAGCRHQKELQITLPSLLFIIQLWYYTDFSYIMGVKGYIIWEFHFSIVNRELNNICNKNEGWVWQDGEPTALKEVCCGSKMPFQVETPRNHFLSGTCWTWDQPSEAEQEQLAQRHERALFLQPSQVKRHGSPISFSKLKGRLSRLHTAMGPWTGYLT